MDGGIKEWPEDERPREQLLKRGPESLTEAELLALILRTGDAASGRSALYRRTAITPRVREILGWYGADNPGTLTNLARLLTHGRLAGTGKLVILPVDQGLGPFTLLHDQPQFHLALNVTDQVQRLAGIDRQSRNRRSCFVF